MQTRISIRARSKATVRPTNNRATRMAKASTRTVCRTIPLRRRRMPSEPTRISHKVEQLSIVEWAIVDLLGNLPDRAGTWSASSRGMNATDLQKRTMRFAVRTVLFCRTLPTSWEARRIAGQLIDAMRWLARADSGSRPIAGSRTDVAAGRSRGTAGNLLEVSEDGEGQSRTFRHE